MRGIDRGGAAIEFAGGGRGGRANLKTPHRCTPVEHVGHNDHHEE
ncbi:hypothetical protein ACGGAQ_20925 [Micromonospora sp. NPDC047557]